MTIKISGVIVSNDDKWIYDWYGIESTCPNDVVRELNALNGADAVVEISSGGGYVWAGSDMYYDLKSYSGKVTSIVKSVAASAATLPAMAGDITKIVPTAQVMIHNITNLVEGDYRDMAHMSEVLLNYNKTLANAYRLKSGLPEAEILEMMNKETWLSPQQAKEKGFVDEIMFDDDMMLVASINSQMIPFEVIKKMRNSKFNPNNKMAEARLNLLRLKGVQNV